MVTRDTQRHQHAERDTRAAISPATPARRRFLTAGTCIATSLAVPDIAHAAALPRTGLTASDFRRVLHTPFRAMALSRHVPEAVALTLTEVTAVPHPHPGLDSARAGELAFSLKFSGDIDKNARVFSQDTYLLSHPALGDFAALLVPTGDGAGLRAEFHRI